MMCDLDPRGYGTVDYAARTLRKDGVVTRSRRGRGAIPVGASDAAALIIALNCAEGATEGARVARTFWGLVRSRSYVPPDLPERFTNLLDSGTLGEAIEVLVRDAAVIDASPAKRTRPLRRKNSRLEVAGLFEGIIPGLETSVVVDFLQPPNSARIRVRTVVDDEGHSRPEVTFDLMFREPGPVPGSPSLIDSHHSGQDRWTRRTVTLTTFLAIQHCLATTAQVPGGPDL